VRYANDRKRTDVHRRFGGNCSALSSTENHAYAHTSVIAGKALMIVCQASSTAGQPPLRPSGIFILSEREIRLQCAYFSRCKKCSVSISSECECRCIIDKAYGFQVSNLVMETLQKLYMSYRV